MWWTLALAVAVPLPAARLLVSRGVGTEACALEVPLQRSVRAQLGYDPFQPEGQFLVSLKLSRPDRGPSLEGEFSLLDSQGRILGQQILVSAAGDCQELTLGLSLAVALALDAHRQPDPTQTEPRAAPVAVVPNPQTVDEQPASQASVVASADPSPAAGPPAALRPIQPLVGERQPLPRPVPAARSWPQQLELRAGALGSINETVAPNFGFSVGLDAVANHFALGLEARGDLPTSASLPAGGRDQAWVLAGTLAPCYRGGSLQACGLVSGGVLQASGLGLSDATSLTDLYLAAGGRLGYQLSLQPRWALRLYVDVLVPLALSSFQVGNQLVWTQPAVSVGLGICVVARVL